MKAKILSLPQLLKKAQRIFNEYIRLRDKDKGCISAYCKGEVEHAGHYFSRGHHSALRFDEVNVNGCCTRCNRHLSGNLIRYRQGLVMKYGEPRVKILESASVRKGKSWTRFELIAIIDHYQKEIKKYENPTQNKPGHDFVHGRRKES